MANFSLDVSDKESPLYGAKKNVSKKSNNIRRKTALKAYFFPKLLD